MGQEKEGIYRAAVFKVKKSKILKIFSTLFGNKNFLMRDPLPLYIKGVVMTEKKINA